MLIGIVPAVLMLKKLTCTIRMTICNNLQANMHTSRKPFIFFLMVSFIWMSCSTSLSTHIKPNARLRTEAMLYNLSSKERHSAFFVAGSICILTNIPINLFCREAFRLLISELSCWSCCAERRIKLWFNDNTEVRQYL